MSNSIRRRGLWWQTMGFTQTRLIGVFVTECFACLVGISLAIGAILFPHPWGLHFLLGAVSSFLLAISILLSSILSLLFFAAWPADDGAQSQEDGHSE